MMDEGGTGPSERENLNMVIRVGQCVNRKDWKKTEKRKPKKTKKGKGEGITGAARGGLTRL